jgi:hypothetical protein
MNTTRKKQERGEAHNPLRKSTEEFAADTQKRLDRVFKLLDGQQNLDPKAAQKYTEADKQKWRDYAATVPTRAKSKKTWHVIDKFGLSQKQYSTVYAALWGKEDS